MQHDLSDVVAWAVEEGIADGAKVAIMGGSYGGYATLAGLPLPTCMFKWWNPPSQLVVEKSRDAAGDHAGVAGTCMMPASLCQGLPLCQELACRL